VVAFFSFSCVCGRSARKSMLRKARMLQDDAGGADEYITVTVSQYDTVDTSANDAFLNSDGPAVAVLDGAGAGKAATTGTGRATVVTINVPSDASAERVKELVEAATAGAGIATATVAEPTITVGGDSSSGATASPPPPPPGSPDFGSLSKNDEDTIIGVAVGLFVLSCLVVAGGIWYCAKKNRATQAERVKGEAVVVTTNRTSKEEAAKGGAAAKKESV